MNAPEPRGREVDTCMFVDSNHTGDKYLADWDLAF